MAVSGQKQTTSKFIVLFPCQCSFAVPTIRGTDCILKFYQKLHLSVTIQRQFFKIAVLMPLHRLLLAHFRCLCYFYHIFPGQCTMCCDVILWKYKNYYTMAVQLCHFIYTGMNGKWFGFQNSTQIPKLCNCP